MIFEILFCIMIVVLCIVMEGFFSGTETALVSVDRIRIRAMAEKGSKRAVLVDNALKNPEKFFSTTLLGTNIAVVLSNVIITFLLIGWFGESYAYLTIVVMTPLVLVFGEIIPKTVCRYHAEKISGYVVVPIKIFSIVFYPFVLLMSGLTNLFVKILGLKDSELKPVATREDLENYLSLWNLNGGLKIAERKMIERIFDFSDTVVDDIMIPLVNVKAVEVTAGVENAIRLAKKTGFSRIPVYSDKTHNIIGIVFKVQ